MKESYQNSSIIMNTQVNKKKNSLNQNLSNLEITKEVDIVS